MMKKLIFILPILLFWLAGQSQQTKTTLVYDSVIVRQLTKNSHFYVKGTGYFTDTVTITTMGDADSSNRAASMAALKRLHTIYNADGVFPTDRVINAQGNSFTLDSTNIIYFAGYDFPNDLVTSFGSPGGPGSFSVHTGKQLINQGADIVALNDDSNPNAPYVSLTSTTPTITKSIFVGQTFIRLVTAFSGLEATSLGIYQDSVVIGNFEDSALLKLKNIPSGDNYSQILAWDFATGKIGKTTGSGLFWPTSGTFSLRGTVTGNNGGHDFTLSGTHETFLISDTTGFSSIADDKTKEKTVILNHTSNAVMAWLNEAETRRNFLLIDSTGAAISLAAGKIFRGGDDDSTSYIGASYVQKDWVLDHIGGGGGGSLLPLIGTGTATGDIVGDVGAHDLDIHNDAGSGFSIFHTSGTVINYAGFGSLAMQTAGNFFEDQHGTPKGIQYDADYSTNYSTRSLVDSGFVGSVIRGDSLLPVTARGNRTDSILYRQVSVPNNNVDSILALGNSIIIGLSTPTPDSIFIRRVSYRDHNLPIDFEAVSGRGAFRAIMNDNLYENPGSNKITAVMVGINDIRKGGNNQKTYQKIINGLKSIFVNHNLLNYTAASSLSNAGTWFTYDCTAAGVGGKSVGKGTATNNDSIWAITNGTSAVVTVIGGDGVKNSFTTAVTFKIDGVSQGTFTTNGQTDNINDNDFDNAKIPMAFVFTGLAPGTHRITAINNAADTLIVDYIGTLKPTGNCFPMLLWDIAYLNSTGYNSINPPVTSNNTIDSINNKIDSLVNALPAAYKLYHAFTNNFFNPATGLVADGVHHNDVGQLADANSMFAVWPYLDSDIPQDGTIYYNQGFYGVQDRVSYRFATTDNLAIPGTGLSVSGNTWNVNLSTGISGGQTLIGSTSTNSGITYKATTGVGVAGADHVFTGGNNGGTEIFRATSTGYVGIGVSPTQTMLSIKSIAATDRGILIKEASSQTALPLQIVNSSDVLKFKVDPDGGMQILGGITSYGGASITLQMSGGAGYMDFYDGGSWLTGNVRFGVLNMQPAGSSIAEFSAGGFYLGGGTTPVASALMEMSSTTKGFLPPTMTTTQMNAISSPATGLEISNSTTTQPMRYDGSAWRSSAPITGSFSQVGAATTVFTVTFGGTQPNSTYKVNVTPTAALSAALFYITNKTTTTFDVTYLAGLTGTVTFDWALNQ